MTTLIYKIPPNLPLPKGGFSPLFGKEGCGEIFGRNVNSIMRPLKTGIIIASNFMKVVLKPLLGNLEQNFESRLRGRVSRKSCHTGSYIRALRQLFCFYTA